MEKRREFLKWPQNVCFLLNLGAITIQLLVKNPRLRILMLLFDRVFEIMLVNFPRFYIISGFFFFSQMLNIHARKHFFGLEGLCGQPQGSNFPSQ